MAADGAAEIREAGAADTGAILALLRECRLPIDGVPDGSATRSNAVRPRSREFASVCPASAVLMLRQL